MQTIDFHEMVHQRIARDPAVREAILKEGLYCIRSGELAVGMSILGDYIAGTGGDDGLDSYSDEDVWRSLLCDIPEEAHPIVIGAVKRWLTQDRLARPDDEPEPSGKRRKRGRSIRNKPDKPRHRPLLRKFDVLAASDC
jgi:hypothetical protein